MILQSTIRVPKEFVSQFFDLMMDTIRVKHYTRRSSRPKCTRFSKQQFTSKTARNREKDGMTYRLKNRAAEGPCQKFKNSGTEPRQFSGETEENSYVSCGVKLYQCMATNGLVTAAVYRQTNHESRKHMLFSCCG